MAKRGGRRALTAKSVSGVEGRTSQAQAEARPQQAEQVEQKFYEWAPGRRISYRVMRGTSEEETPLVLLTGFGVGNFHYDNLLKELQGSTRDVFLMDFFGQGASWPTVDPCPSPEPATDPGFEQGFGPGPVAPEFEGFRFSADMWTEQLQYFMEQLVGRPAILCGNSLGGFVSVNLASQRPDLVAGLVLLNATPFWGTTALKFWDGTYPLPESLSSFGRKGWNWIRSPTTISRMLDFVYAKPLLEGGYSQGLVEQIIGPTMQPAAASVFCSILASPPPKRSFTEMLDRIRRAGLPCMLAYGREDPWVVPLWGRRAAHRLEGVVHYYEMSPAGHCPQDEVPDAVAYLLNKFVMYVSGTAESMPDNSELQQLGGPIDIIFHPDSTPRTPIEFVDSIISQRSEPRVP